MTYSPEQLHAARVYAAQPEARLIASIRSGETICNDPAGWVADLEAEFDRILAGECDGNFTIGQRMRFFLTGNEAPFLAPHAGAAA